MLASVGVLAFWQQGSVRVLEARLAGAWFGSVVDGPVAHSGDGVYFRWTAGPVPEVGLRITAECTVALFAGPLCLLAAGLLLFARTSMARLLGGLLVGMITVVVVNQLRLAVIAVGVQHWGVSGYDVTHTFVGTVVSLAGFAAGLLAMLRIATRDRSAAPS